MTLEVPDKLLLTSPRTMAIYIHLAVNGGAAESLTQLAAWAHVNIGSVKEATDKLESIGLIRKSLMPECLRLPFSGHPKIRIEIVQDSQ